MAAVSRGSIRRPQTIKHIAAHAGPKAEIDSIAGLSHQRLANLQPGLHDKPFDAGARALGVPRVLPGARMHNLQALGLAAHNHRPNIVAPAVKANGCRPRRKLLVGRQGHADIAAIGIAFRGPGRYAESDERLRNLLGIGVGAALSPWWLRRCSRADAIDRHSKH